MKNKFTTIYAIFASVLFILTIFYFGFNLYSEYSKGYLRTKTTFDQLISTIKKEPSNIRIPNVYDYSFIKMQQNGEVFYQYPSSEYDSSSSNLIKNWNTSFTIGEDKYFINADMYLLRPSSIRFYARNSFLIVFLITVITIILIITITLSEKNDSYIESKDEDIPDYDSFNAESSNITSNQPEIITDTKAEEEVIEEEKLDFNQIDKQNDEEKEAAAQIKLPSEEIKPQELEINDNNPYGLYSPKSGIGWESYLLPRLTNELNRAISSELDLALFVIKVVDINKNEEELKKICDYLSVEFQFKDLIFEYKEDCIVAIKINLNLDDAVNFADKIHGQIESKSGLKCFIGISTRTIRIIGAERLLQEAEEALIHAQEEKDTPIIAFRANAQKYKEFIEQN
jgi:GGDEF domain-containing protein